VSGAQKANAYPLRMRNLFFLLLPFVFGIVSLGPALHGQTTSAENPEKIYKELLRNPGFRKADQELTTAYGKLRSGLTESARNELRLKQAAWIRERDREVLKALPKNRENVATTITLKRAYELLAAVGESRSEEIPQKPSASQSSMSAARHDVSESKSRTPDEPASFAGIGVALDFTDTYPKIESILPNSPALKSGKLKAGDRIMAVSTDGSTDFKECNSGPDNIMSLIRGIKGSWVRLQVIPAGSSVNSERFIVDIKRDYSLPTIEGPIEQLNLSRLYGNFSDFTFVGTIDPSPDVLKIIDSLKDGRFSSDDTLQVWRGTIYQLCVEFSLIDRLKNHPILLPQGIGEPSRQMNGPQIEFANKVLALSKSNVHEEIIALCLAGKLWELWTTEGIYIGGLSAGIQKASNFEANEKNRLLFDNPEAEFKKVRFWDLALSNDSCKTIDVPTKDKTNRVNKFSFRREIEPPTTTAVFAPWINGPGEIDPESTLVNLFAIQSSCRRFLCERIAQILQDSRVTLKDHSGFRAAKWGLGFDDTCRLLTPFLWNQGKRFISSRPSSDVKMMFKSHPLRSELGVTIDSLLWNSLFLFAPRQIAKNSYELGCIETVMGGLSRTKSIGGTGIPIAPNLDYWSFETRDGVYTAWFVDDRFYAIEIRPNLLTEAPVFNESLGATRADIGRSHPSEDRSELERAKSDEIMSELTDRYGKFADQPDQSRYIHEDKDGGTMVVYRNVNAGNQPLKIISSIYHYSLGMRPHVNAKLESLASRDEEKMKTDKAKPKANKF
jgi:hypothetical protein